MAENILREYLVKLGFNVDAASWRRFETGLVTTAKRVTELTLSLGAMATAVAAAVSVTAKQFDLLYYATQRTGASAQNLMRFRYAAEQVGIGAERFAAQAAALANQLRDMPALRQWLASVTGATGDTTEMLKKLAEWYKAQMELGQWQEARARAILSTFGVDTDLIRQMAMNMDAFNEALKHSDDALNKLGINAKEAAKQGVTYARQLNELFTTFSYVWDKIAIALMPVLINGLVKLNAYLNEHLEDIRKYVEETIGVWAKWAQDPKTWDSMKSGLAEIMTLVRHVNSAFQALIDSIKWIIDHWKYIENIIPGAGAVKQLRNEAEIRAHQGGAAPDQTMAQTSGTTGPAVYGFQYLYGKLSDWLSERTHSPNVEIHEAAGMWERMKQWLFGSTASIPWVRIARDPSERTEGSDFASGGGGGGGGGGIAGGLAGGETRGLVGGGGLGGEGTGSAGGYTGTPDTAYMPPSGRGGRGDPRGLIPAIRAAALRYGIDPDVAVRVARSEGLGNYRGDHGTSFGAFQLHVGGGLGDVFQRETGLDPRDPKNERAMIDWTLRNVRRYGWGPWHGARRAGIGDREGIGPMPPGMAGAPAFGPGGGGALSAARGIDTTKINPQLMSIMQAAVAGLPPGYTAQITSGSRTGGLANSQHHGGNAMDVQIFDPQGHAIPNRGADTTGMYRLLAMLAIRAQMRMFPKLAGRFSWGGFFGIRPGSRIWDLMHYDLGGSAHGSYVMEQMRRLWAQAMGGSNVASLNAPPPGAVATAEIGSNRNVAVTASPTFHVYGSGDPHATGRAVFDRQTRLYEDLARNLNTAAV